MIRGTKAQKQQSIKKKLSKLGIEEPETTRLEKIKQIKPSHQRFIEAYLRIGNVKEAYKKIYPKASLSTCYQRGLRLFKRYSWAFEALLEEAGLTPISAAKRHKQLLYHKSAKVSLGALKLYYDIIGRTNQAKQLQQTVNNLVIVKDRQKGIFTVGIEGGQEV